MNLGSFLKQKRKEKRLTLKDVANAVGVSDITVSRWERNEIKNMKVDKIQALAAVLGISELDFFYNWDIDGKPLEDEQITCSELRSQIITLLNKCYEMSYPDKQMILNNLDYICDKYKK